LNKLGQDIYKKLIPILGKQGAVLHEPKFIGNEKEYLIDCINSTFVSSNGNYITEFEKKLSEITSLPYVVATVNGTSALHIGLQALGVNENHEILIPSFTFVATANAVTYCGAHPHFVDINKETLGIDASKLEKYLKEISITKNGKTYNKKTKRRLKALIVVHVFGHASNLDELLSISKKFNLDLIEDAAEALGTEYKNKHVGSHGKFATLSFNGNKIVTTGGGGAVITKSKKLATVIRHLATTAKKNHRFEFVHDQIGYNYRLPNLNAALGCAQLEKLDYFIASKRKLAKTYENIFSKLKYLEFMTEPLYSKSNYWLNALILDNEKAKERDNIINFLIEKKIYVRPAWKLLSTLPPFINSPKSDLNESENLVKRIINLPSSSGYV
jgi:perosamine synthetase